MTRPENIFYEQYTFVQYVKGSEIIAVYFNPDGGYEGKGTFMEHHFPLDYLLSHRDEDFDEEFLFGDAFNCPTYGIDFGGLNFSAIITDLLDNKDWVELGSGEVAAFVKGILKVIGEEEQDNA